MIGTNVCQNTKTITGDFEDLTWFSFDMDLWTFNIHANVTVLSEKTEINSTRKDYVKALGMKSNSKIGYLPVKVSEVFPNLVAYGSQNCSLREIRAEPFLGLRKLQYLSLQQHMISHIAPDAFRDLKRLKYLFLNQNHLQYVDEHIFKPLKNLLSLKMSKNNIEFASRDAFNSLIELRNISMATNGLKLITEEHFKNNNNLEYIWLNDNNLKLIKYTTFDNMTNLKYVHLKNNACISNAFKSSAFSTMRELLENNC